MVSTKSLTVNKHIIMPIVVFMYVFALVRLVELINEVIVGYDNRILFILHLISTALWIFAGDILLVLHLRRLRKAFYITAVVSAGLLTISTSSRYWPSPASNSFSELMIAAL